MYNEVTSWASSLWRWAVHIKQCSTSQSCSRYWEHNRGKMDKAVSQSQWVKIQTKKKPCCESSVVRGQCCFAHRAALTSLKLLLDIHIHCNHKMKTGSFQDTLAVCVSILLHVELLWYGDQSYTSIGPGHGSVGKLTFEAILQGWGRISGMGVFDEKFTKLFECL